MTAAHTLRQARTDAGLTLRALAAAAGTSHSTIAAYEAGTKVPSTATFERLIHAAGFSLDRSLQRRHRGESGDELPRGEELVAVLELAGTFPARHAPTLTAPVFGPVA